jgi:hypothetical protein
MDAWHESGISGTRSNAICRAEYPHPNLLPVEEGITSPLGRGLGEGVSSLLTCNFTSWGADHFPWRIHSPCCHLDLLEDAVELIKIDRLHQMRQETSLLCLGKIFGHAIARQGDPSKAIIVS